MNNYARLVRREFALIFQKPRKHKNEIVMNSDDQIENMKDKNIY